MSILIQVPKGQNIHIEAIQFSGGERHIQLPDELMSVTTRLKIQANIRNSNDLMDLLLTVNALKHQHGDILKIDLEVPYLPYARQDRVCAPGQAFSLEVLAGLLNNLEVEKLVTWDCHSTVGTELTKGINIEPADIILQSDELLEILQDENSVLVCPDKGAVNRCTQIKEQLNLRQMVLCEKQRDPKTGKIFRTDVLVGDLTGKTAVITDDICDGGFTFIKIAEQLKEKNAERIILFVTHGIFSKGLDVFDNLVDSIYTTTSFPRSKQENSNKKLNIINYTLGEKA